MDEACSSVKAWYCKCRADPRVVAILCLLENAGQRDTTGFEVRNWGDFVDDAYNIPTPFDETDCLRENKAGKKNDIK